ICLQHESLARVQAVEALRVDIKDLSRVSRGTSVRCHEVESRAVASECGIRLHLVPEIRLSRALQKPGGRSECRHQFIDARERLFASIDYGNLGNVRRLAVPLHERYTGVPTGGTVARCNPLPPCSAGREYGEAIELHSAARRIHGHKLRGHATPGKTHEGAGKRDKERTQT